MAVVSCLLIGMCFLTCSLCSCRAAPAQAAGSGEGGRGAINLVSSAEQRPVDSDMITSSFSAHVFVTDQAGLSLPSNVITLKEGVSASRLLHSAGAVQNSFENLSSGTGMLRRTMTRPLGFLHQSKIETSFKAHFKIFFLSEVIGALEGLKPSSTDNQMNFGMFVM